MKVRFRRLPVAGACALVSIVIAGCRQDMHNQPKMIPQRHTTLFQDGRSARQQVAGTVARSQSVEASYMTTGLINGVEGEAMPFPVTQTVMERGQERFNVYCTPCHSRVGNGKGAIVGRGYYAAGNFQSARLRQAPLGHFFWVITHGYGAMPNYSVEIRAEDRWAIAAYIRALQLSQSATRNDVPVGASVAHMRDLLQQASLPKNFLDSWDTSVDADEDTTAAATVPSPAAPATAAAIASNHKTAEPGTKKALTKPEEIASVGGKTDSEKPAETAAIPAKTAAKGDAAHGHVLYTNNCSACHQPTRAGLPPIFPSLLGIVEKDGENKVRKVAKEGIADSKPPMPPHPNLSDDDLNDLIAYLRTK
jgi:mono/diheme cytochrome c family protein